MSDNSKIEWTDATWQPVTGCSIVSPGCTNCYAMKLAGTRLRHHPSRAGLTLESKAGPVWNGKVRFNEQWLTQPLRWKSPRRIFVCAHGDLFHESGPDEWIDKVFAVMALCPQHTFQVLTKRSARMREYLTGPHRVRVARAIVSMMKDEKDWCGARAVAAIHAVVPLPNVWLGVSTERQQEADERIPDLLATPAAVRFISAEPLLGPIDLMEVIPNPIIYNAVHGMERLLDWVIVGGESGPGSRPMHPDWARWLRDQCAAAGVPFFFKQWGEWAASGKFMLKTVLDGTEVSHPRHKVSKIASGLDDGNTFVFRVGKKAAGRLLDGVEHNGMPHVLEAFAAA